jgi:hypothetical protein
MLEHLRGTFHPVAAGAANGRIPFFQHKDISGSSMYRQAEGPALDGCEITVEMRRLDDLLPPNLARPVLLKIDTQGHEIEVIRGAERLLEVTDVAILETSMMQFREGIPVFADVIAEMAARNFAVYDLLEGHSRMLDGALAQVDVVFVPTASRLRQDPRFFDDLQLRDYLGVAS